jgi:hypothetical protein
MISGGKIMLESYEEYLKRTNREDTRKSWKWWLIEVCGMEETEAIRTSITMYKPLKQ